MSELIDTGFEDAIAGEAWVDPAETRPQPVTVAVTKDDPCKPSSGPDAPAMTAGAIPASTPPASTISSSETPSSLAPSIDPPGFTPEGLQAAKSLLRLPVLSASELARLARDFAMDLKERHVILTDNKLTEAQYEFIENHNEFYKAALHAACTEWHAPLNTQDRIKVEAAAILEDSLIGLGARMQSKTEGLPGVIEAAKLFAKVAGVGERETGGGAPGERFVINIDLGGGKTLTASTTPAPVANVPGPAQLALPPDGETQRGT